MTKEELNKLINSEIENFQLDYQSYFQTVDNILEHIGKFFSDENLEEYFRLKRLNHA